MDQKKIDEMYRIDTAKYIVIDEDGVEKEITPRHGVLFEESLVIVVSRLDRKIYSFVGIRASARKQFTENKIIDPFVLGQKDISHKFNMPQLLYGREAEIETLMAVFDKASLGTTEIMLVTGLPGIGKSALVHEIHKPIVAKRGYFPSGKYEQLRRDIPYNAIIQALQKLVRQN